MVDADGFTQESAGGFKGEKNRTPQQEEEQATIRELRDCLRVSNAYDSAQRKGEEEQSLFEGEDMWDKAARDARAERTDENTGGIIPGKPTLSVHLLDQNIEQIVSEARQARLALTVKPKRGIATTKIAEAYKGLAKWIQAESGAFSIRMWALQRAARLGRGGYYLTAEFANDGDFDLDLVLKRILDYSCVYWDPAGTDSDRSNAGWCLMAEWISEADRRRRWKDKPFTWTDQDTWAGGETGVTDYSDWFDVEAEQVPGHRRVRIVTAWRVIYIPEDLGYHPTVGTMPVAKMPKQCQVEVVAGAPGTRRRTIEKRSVEIIVCDGTTILERTPFKCAWIPVMECIGREYFLRGRRRFKGIIANAMDILRAINVVMSAAVEAAAATPRAPYLLVEGQDEGYEKEWDELFITNRSRIRYRNVDLGGKPAPPPQRQQTEAQVQGLLLMLRALHEMYHAVTGSVAPQQRAMNPYDRSGKAIEALLRQSAAGTSSFLDNLATITMPYEGKVLIDAIPNYYDTPGRVLRVMGDEGDDEIAIMLKRPFVRGPEGVPMAVPCPACQGQGVVRGEITRRQPTGTSSTCPECKGQKFATKENMPPEWQGADGESRTVDYIDFADGQYTVAADLDRDTKNSQTEALQGMEALAAAAPPLVPQFADLWVRAMGFTGSSDIADRLAANNPSALKDDDMMNASPAIKARFAKLSMDQQQLMMALEEAQKLLETDAVKTAGAKEVAAIRGSLQMQLEKIKQQGKVMELAREQHHELAMTKVQTAVENMQQAAEHRHEMLLQLLKEQQDKEIERHNVELHDQAARIAEERLEGSTVRGERREEGRELRTERREDDRQIAAESREEGREARGRMSEEGGNVRAEAREEGRDIRSGGREEQRTAREGTRTEGRENRAANRDAGLQAKADERAAKLKPQPKGPTKS